MTDVCIAAEKKSIFVPEMKKKKILFVCLGNICRSPMAEAMFKHMAAEAGRSEDFEISSAAVSEEEWGNPIYPLAASILDRHHIAYDGLRTARQMKASDYEKFDWIIAMDKSNIQGVRRIAGGDPDDKIRLLLDYAGEHRNVADPWYTRDFETAFDDIHKGCRALLDELSR